jgi:hypothetical protein
VTLQIGTHTHQLFDGLLYSTLCFGICGMVCSGAPAHPEAVGGPEGSGSWVHQKQDLQVQCFLSAKSVQGVASQGIALQSGLADGKTCALFDV